ncbi:MAG: cache domain-containing protein [Bacteroidales bacterium]|nr:cache domain-containing protein [Bacteroidales bacterium]
MSERRTKWKKATAFILLAVLIAILALPFLVTFGVTSEPKMASRVEKILGEKIALLDTQMKDALEGDHTAWLNMYGVPDDMILYRFESDTLQSWVNQFSVLNDDIKSRVLVPSLSNLRGNASLSDITKEASFVNYGPKWYLVKAIVEGDTRIIGGLEISDEIYRLKEGFSIQPLSVTGGTAIYAGDKPVFKITTDTIRGRTHGNALFSPTLYSDSTFFPSLGVMLTANVIIIILLAIVYLARALFIRKRWAVVLCRLGVLILPAYIYFILSSVTANSNIRLELYKINELSVYTGIVYVTVIGLIVSTLMLLGIVLEAIFRRNVLVERGLRFIFSAVAAVLLVLTTASLGFRKEADRVDVWANRLSMDRDISLEIKLRTEENTIANDPLIASLTMADGTDAIILNRISEQNLRSVSQDYDLSLLILRDNDPDPKAVAYFNDRIRSGEPIADGSRFLYSSDASGRARYTGIFLYFDENLGISRMMLGVEPKSYREGRGYDAILGLQSPGKVLIPPTYSYAKFIDGRLASYTGSYPYPTARTGNKLGHYIERGYSHIARQVADNEVIILSRQKTDTFEYFIATFFIGVVIFIIISTLIFPNHGRKRKERQKNYYKTRIGLVLYVSLIVTLLTLASISTIFVYNRNIASNRNMMSEQISSIKGLIESRIRHFGNLGDLRQQEIDALIEEIGTSTRTDITLYDRSGKVASSTNVEIFYRMIFGSRVDEEAYNNIVNKHWLYFAKKQKAGKRSYYMIYAPIINSAGEMMGIVSAPYNNDNNYDFETAAIIHTVSIFTVFVVLLILARIIITAVVDMMFKPLSEMGRKMNKTDISNPEYIEYDRDDEISALVKAYNVMVHDLSDSTKKLAQAERDKAWSNMARNVAHEIKNPLTPMKMQLQRIISLKSRNNPLWVERFDEAAKIFLDQIDILTDTANEFSTFAKLYTEEPAEIDIDRLIQDQVTMFDNRDNIKITYIGIDGAHIMGPKPQLTRVFVNLITNAIQAIEGMNDGEGRPDGQIFISLRLSQQDGFYDISIEDNGPGVAEENLGNLFVPEFTTKSSGSGLGLAICRNIIDKCGGDIQYSRSYTLQGACFTIHYPKMKI